jgi:Uma2 family endonuclease
MAASAKILPRHSVAEYLALEERSDVRHEYVDGFIHALAGETERHNLLVLNIAFLLRAVARGRSCRVVTENVKLHIAAINKIYYPDVMVLCEPGDDHPSIKRRPCFIAEVLSPSTEATDRREKLEAYRMVPGLQTYALVDPHRRYVEVHQNAGGIWRALATQGDGIVVIPCLDASLSLDGLYEGLTPPPD